MSRDIREAPLPVDRVARRVVQKAKPENCWSPMPIVAGHAFSREVLPTAPLPPSAPKELLGIVGTRRGRMVLLGYAEDQRENRSKRGARWVTRCDCGNYEYRCRILRWIGTKADDMCRECQKRGHLTGRVQISREPAERATVAATQEGKG